MYQRGRNVYGAAICLFIIISISVVSSPVNAPDELFEDVTVTTNKYRYDIGESVEITLHGVIMLPSMALIPLINYMVLDPEGNYVKEEVSLFKNVDHAIGWWYGPENFSWNQTYLVYDRHSDIPFEPNSTPKLIPPTGEQVPPGKYYVVACVEGTIIGDPVEIFIGNPTLRASVDIKPNTLNLKSKGKWMSCNIDLPNGYIVQDIELDSIKLENTISTKWGEIQDSTLIVKFKKNQVTEMFNSINGRVKLKVEGQLSNGTQFIGYDWIRLLSFPRK
jgi:hypothetical protein